ncbi:hypothetical protein SLE2022_165580 [Rubroshorea leprosula]
MSNKSPIFPMPEPQHFSDYGFDPQIDYFQVLEEARKHKRETSRASMDPLQFKLQRTISKDESKKTHKAKKKRWWRNALYFLKRRWVPHGGATRRGNLDLDVDEDVHHARTKVSRASLSGPIYITESRSGSSTPHRTTSRPTSGPLAGTLSPDFARTIPYLSLKELNMEEQHHRVSTSALPIYLVT